jgi:hypothetical protein
MDTSFSGHAGGDAISTVRNSRFRRNQTLENHLVCAKLLADAETKSKLLYDKILTMSAKHYDSHIKICRILNDFVHLRHALQSEIHSQIKLPNGADESYLEVVYNPPLDNVISTTPSTDKWE